MIHSPPQSSPPQVSLTDGWLFVDLLNLFLAYLETPAIFIVLIFIYREKHGAAEGSAHHFTVRAPGCDPPALETSCSHEGCNSGKHTVVQKKAHTSHPQNCLYWSLIEKEVI